LIQLPGLSEADKESAATNIQKAAYLEFRLVKEDSDEIINNNEPFRRATNSQAHSMPPENGKPSQVPKSCREEKGRERSGRRHRQKRPWGAAIWASRNRVHAYGRRGKRFADVTRDNIGRRLAIVLDGQLYSAPNINSEIDTGNGEITGHYTQEGGAEACPCSKTRCARRSTLIIPKTWIRRWAKTRFTAASGRRLPPSFSFRFSC
jgi:SecD/SecF fusion protein